MKALANEIAKNLVLAGIGSMTIQDDQLVQEDDLGSQFFVSEQHIGQNVSLDNRQPLPLESNPFPARRSIGTPNTKAQSQSLFTCRHAAGQITTTGVLHPL